MIVGLIVEGLPDSQVLCYFAKRIRPGIKVKSRTLGNKSKLIDNCGKTAKNMLEMECDHVVIAWDLHPDSRRRKKRKRRGSRQLQAVPLNCELDSESIVESIHNACADDAKVSLVCIDAMLETWLLFDYRGFRDFLLSRGGLREPVKAVPKLRQNKHPKNLMKKLFREKSRSGLKYNDVDDAIKIAQAIPKEEDDLKRLKKLESFAQFAAIISGMGS